MRTTVTLDPDVQALLKKAMRKRDQSFKRVLNDAVRVGLREVPAADTQPPERWTFPTFELGPLLVPEQNMNRLAAELENEEIIAKLRRGA
jgi:hypothetical protein